MKLSTHFVGRKVKSALRVQGYLQIYFCDASILNVFNRVRIPQISEDFLAQLTEKIITNEIIDSDTLALEFSGGIRLEIGLADADFQGPEALAVTEPDGRITIWP